MGLYLSLGIFKDTKIQHNICLPLIRETLSETLETQYDNV